MREPCWLPRMQKRARSWETEHDRRRVQATRCPVRHRDRRLDIQVKVLPKGGHFAPWQQPPNFVDEVRAGFTTLPQDDQTPN